MLEIQTNFKNVSEVPEHKLRKNLRYELDLYCGKLLRRIRNEMAIGDFIDNNPFWKAAKGDRGVYYNTGFLRRQPDKKLQIGSGNVFVTCLVGFIRPGMHPGGSISVSKLVDVQRAYVAWKPSKKQRKAFWNKIFAALGSDFDMMESDIKPKEIWENPARDIFGFMNNEIKYWDGILLDHVVKAIKKSYIK